MDFFNFLSTTTSLTLITICAGSVAFFAIKSRARLNYLHIDSWVSNMDITAHEQRFQGSRCKKLFEFYMRRDGISGLTLKRLYSTVSGRYFEIEISSELCEVTSWSVILIPEEDALLFLDYVAEPSNDLSTS